MEYWLVRLLNLAVLIEIQLHKLHAPLQWHVQIDQTTKIPNPHTNESLGLVFINWIDRRVPSSLMLRKTLVGCSCWSGVLTTLRRSANVVMSGVRRILVGDAAGKCTLKGTRLKGNSTSQKAELHTKLHGT